MYDVAKLFVISLLLCTFNYAVAMNVTGIVDISTLENPQQRMQEIPKKERKIRDFIKEQKYQDLFIGFGGASANLLALLNNAKALNPTTAVSAFLGACNSFKNTQHDWQNISIKQKIRNMRNISDIFASLFTTISSSLSAFGKNGDVFSYMSAIPNAIIHLSSFVNFPRKKDTNEQKFQSSIKVFSNIAYIIWTVNKKLPYIAIGNIFDAIFSMYCFSIFDAINNIIIPIE